MSAHLSLRHLLPSPLRPFARRVRRRLQLKSSQASTASSTVRYSVHDLTMNHAITSEEYAYCLSLVESLQRLYDDTSDYIVRHKLDRTIVLPGNEWTEISPTTGLTFRTAYNDINFLRLNAPFAGYHLAVLDRLDPGGKFDRKEAEAFVARLSRDGIPDDIAKLQRRFDPKTRLKHVIPEYLDHIRNVPARHRVATPRMFGEIGLDVGGILVNPDTILCQSRVNGLYCSGVLEKLEADIKRNGRARVLEIGAGWGGLAYALQEIFGDRLEYIVVDLASSLYYAMIYLSILGGREQTYLLQPEARPPEHFKYLFVANYLLDSVMPDLGPIDLAINCMSFPEMSAPQIRYYGTALKRLIGNDGVVFEENGIVHPHHVDCKSIFKEIFPYHRQVKSNVVTTKNWCQDVWASRYLGPIFNRSDVPRTANVSSTEC